MRLTVLRCLLGAAFAAVPAFSAETITYTYDALGRLTASVSSGAVNNGLSNSIIYDPAGNRTSYGVSGASGGVPPPPPPPPPNNPPVANPDSLTAAKCVYRTINVVANDTDADGHYPLSLTAVNQPWAWVESGSNVGMNTPDANGTYVITYTVADSLGATANGSLTVIITGAQQCF